ncbi:MAG: putative F420-0 ABC transporter substrate-binding protein [Actinobacteria bacterium 69-20]|nr:MAG: putative F420-0 ABC transporter substrate-binding protein [Actinobacteria bacterium 69-20]
MVPLVAVIAVVLSSCNAANPPGSAGSARATAPPTSGAVSQVFDSTSAGSSVPPNRPTAAAGYPITVQNCGFAVTVDHSPNRILAIKSTSMELLLALGLADRVVGAAFLDGPVPAQWRDAASSIPVISTGAPSNEPVLGLDPDLIIAGWESNLAPDTAGDRGRLAAAGIASYVSPAACRGASQPKKLTFPMLFAEFEEVGRLLGVRESATALVAAQQRELAAVPKLDRRVTALWWSSGSDTPYVGGGIGAPEMVMNAVGLENIAAGIDQTWTSLGWESIIGDDPDVIILVDASWSSASKKMHLLEQNPATARLTAVREHHFVTIPFPASEAGVRSVDAAKDIAHQLAALGFGSR